MPVQDVLRIKHRAVFTVLLLLLQFISSSWSAAHL
jgi:hypothetical protein